MKKIIGLLALLSFGVACSTVSSSSNSAISSSEAIHSIQEKWLACLGNPSQTEYAGTTIAVASELEPYGVEEVLEVTSVVSETIVGIAFEATVQGNGGNFTFRLGILNDVFGAFVIVSESEHPNFGDRVFNALRNGLTGVTATYENVLDVYVEQGLNIDTAGVTETLQEFMPSMEAMILFYEQRIA